jgi:hypothetical protein
MIFASLANLITNAEGFVSPAKRFVSAVWADPYATDQAYIVDLLHTDPLQMLPGNAHGCHGRHAGMPPNTMLIAAYPSHILNNGSILNMRC